MVLQQATKSTPERKKLTILSVGTIQKVGERQTEKLSFKANDGQHDYGYFTFDSKLFPVIQNGINQVIECDIETSVSGDFTNRKVIQAYVDGKPVSVKSSGFMKRGSSPEERASIESQVAVKLAIELRIADKLPENHPVFKLAMAWIQARITAANS